MNELEQKVELEGLATCPFCGQLVATEPEPDDDYAEAAARVCDCTKAKQWRYRKERIERGEEKLKDLFSVENDEYGIRAIRPEAQELLRKLLHMLVDGQIDNVQVQCGDVCKAKLSITSKGQIKIERVEGRTITLTA